MNQYKRLYENEIIVNTILDKIIRLYNTRSPLTVFKDEHKDEINVLNDQLKQFAL